MLALLLSSCASFTQNQSVEELLRAPQPTLQLHEVQSALNNYVQTTVQLKYPRGEKELSPIIFRDLDLDGASEAIVLYTKKDESQNVHLSILENTGENWIVIHETEGISSEVTDIQIVSFNENVQIIVGYANSTLADEYLSVYEYTGENLNKIYEQSYYAYLAQDINADGTVDFLVSSKNEESGILNLTWMVAEENRFSTMQTIELDDRFVSCTSIDTANSHGNLGIVIEGTFASGYFSNSVLKLNEADNRLSKWPLENIDVPLSSLRVHEELSTSNFGLNKTLHIPTNIVSISTSFQTNRFYYITWQDYLGQLYVPILDLESSPFSSRPPQGSRTGEQNDDVQGEATQLTVGDSYSASPPYEIITDTEEQSHIIIPTSPIFGVYDSTYRYFISMPNEWANKITVTDGAQQGEWQIRDKETNIMLFSVRITDQSSLTGNYTYAADIGENNVFLQFTSHCTEEEEQYIRNGLLIL